MKLYQFSTVILSIAVIVLLFRSCSDKEQPIQDNSNKIAVLQAQIDSLVQVCHKNDLKRAEWQEIKQGYIYTIDSLEEQKQTIKIIYNEEIKSILHRSNNAPIDSLVRDMSGLLSKSDSLIERYTRGL